MTLRKYFIIPLILLLATVATSLITTRSASAAYNGGNLISNSNLLKANSMSAADIQHFLSSKGSGLASRSFVLNCYGAGSQERQWYSAVGAPCDQSVPASHIIYYASQIYGINPQAVLSTLQKEQSLITAPNPTARQIAQAMGYNCPTTGECDGNSNFFYQVDSGTWLLRYHFERARGNMNWWRTSTSWTCGTEKNFYKPNLYPGQNVNFYDVDGVHYRTHFISNAATSSLYCYTPHAYNNPTGINGVPTYGTVGRYYTGSYRFVTSYELWFGPTQTEDTIISYKSHVSDIGWTGWTNNGGLTGTTGRAKVMEAFKIHGDVEYSSYNITTGWQPTVNKGMVSGTTGQLKSIQAIKINLLPSLAGKYDIYYRAHVSDIGWMGWTKNGQPAGVTGGVGKNIEAFDIYLASKGSAAPGATANSYQNVNTVTYNPSISLRVSSHVRNIGWQPEVTEGMISGTTEQAKAIEAMKVKLNNSTGVTGGILYSTHVESVGWQDIKLNNEIAGTTGIVKQMEAMRISLTGNLANSYDIWYRGHVATRGWTGWAKNGSPTGSVGAGKQLEAIETRIVPKNSINLPQQGSLYNPKGQAMPDNYSVVYSAHVSDIGWINNIFQNKVGGTTGKAKHAEAFNFKYSNSYLGTIGINCSVYVKGGGWTSPVAPGNDCGTTGQSKRLEAVRLQITTPTASNYDVYYRVHLSKLGWQSWVKNSEAAGAPNSGNLIEAINVKLVAK